MRTQSYKGISQVNKDFALTPSPGRERNSFGWVHTHHYTMDSGYWVPFYKQDILPHDYLDVKPQFLVRYSNPLVVPVMDNVTFYYYYFYCPIRLVFDNFKAFMGEVVNQNTNYDTDGSNIGGESLVEKPFNTPNQYELPTLTLVSSGDNPAFGIHSLYDYFVLPYNVGNSGYEIQTIPLRMYNLIFNEYLRDENLVAFAPVPTGDGPDKVGSFKLLPCSKFHDYFTSSLPFLQKGPDVSLGLTGDIPVIGDGKALGITNYPNGEVEYLIRSGNFATTFPQGSAISVGKGSGKLGYGAQPVESSFAETGFLGVSTNSASSGLKALLGSGYFIQLAQLRLGFQMMRFYEGQARSGTRYFEMLKFLFDVDIPDSTIQRPVFLGGGKFNVQVNAVVQTSDNQNQVTPLGNLAAFGASYSDKGGYRYDFLEHGYVIGICCVRTNLTYQQGLERDWSRRNRFDFYTPTLAHIAEQAVLNKELCVTGISAYDNDVFGYQGRYDEYRMRLNTVAGYFRSNAPGSLQVWHYGEFFDVSNPGNEIDGFPGLPHLNAKFINQPSELVNRSLNVSSSAPTVPQFLVDVTHRVKAVRTVSKYGIPGFADHF